MADGKRERPEKKSDGKSPVRKLGEWVEGFLDELRGLLDPPRPVPVPVSVHGGRRR